MDENANQSLSSDEQESSSAIYPQILTGKALGANTDYLSAQSFIAQFTGKTFIYLIAGYGEDAFVKIRKAGLDCRDNYFLSDEDISQTISEMMEYLKNELRSLENIQVVLVIVKHNISYFSILGGGQIYLIRHGHNLNLSKNFSFEKLISGVLQPSDQLLIINNRISEGEAREPWDPVFLQDLTETPIDELEEEVEAYLQRFPQSSPIAVASLVIPATEETEESFVPELSSESTVNTQNYHKKEFHFPRPNLRMGIIDLKMKLVLVGAILFFLFLAYFGFTQFHKESQKNTQIKNLLTLSKQDLDKAIAYKDSDQDAARASLGKSRQELQSALKIDSKNGEAKSLQKQISDRSGEILKEYQVSNPPVFLDLSLVKSGFTTNKFSFSLGKLAALDPKQKTLIMVDVSSKNPNILAGQLQLGDAQFASINGDQVFVYSKDKGVISVDVGNSKAEVVVKPDSEWERISDIFGFANNIYLLDEFKNQIWKYIATDSGFSIRNNYLRDDVKADFAGIRKIQIDGSVWVLKSNNTILKFVQGGGDFFSFKGFDQQIDNIKSFYVSDDTDNMYFLDNDQSRVVVTKKDGQYLGQYSGDKFKTTDDIAVDEKSKKLYLLEGSKIYQVELQ